MSTIVLTKDLERAQKSQEDSLRENCILVDVHDQPTGYASKRDCHRVSDNGKLLLHRAFSVFLFNTKGEMLVQRRSSHKVRMMGTQIPTIIASLCVLFVNSLGALVSECVC